MISPDYVLCYIPRAMAILSWKWKFWNLLVRRRRPLWCHWRPLCGFGNFEKKFWIWEFFSKILKIWKFSKFWIKISKVGSKFWRWEGYIGPKQKPITQCFGQICPFYSTKIPPPLPFFCFFSFSKGLWARYAKPQKQIKKIFFLLGARRAWSSNLCAAEFPQYNSDPVKRGS